MQHTNRLKPVTCHKGGSDGESKSWRLEHSFRSSNVSRINHTMCLSLSRSIGDETASSVGCTARPEVTYFALRPGLDAYLVIASDGVWDVMSNDEVRERDCSSEHRRHERYLWMVNTGSVHTDWAIGNFDVA